MTIEMCYALDIRTRYAEPCYCVIIASQIQFKAGCRGRHPLPRRSRTYSLFAIFHFRDVEGAIPYISIYLLRKFDIFRKRNSIYFASQNEWLALILRSKIYRITLAKYIEAVGYIEM